MTKKEIECSQSIAPLNSTSCLRFLSLDLDSIIVKLRVLSQFLQNSCEVYYTSDSMIGLVNQNSKVVQQEHEHVLVHFIFYFM